MLFSGELVADSLTAIALAVVGLGRNDLFDSNRKGKWKYRRL